MDKCPMCQGTGFVDGKICVCVTGERPKEMTDQDALDFLFGIFDKDKKYQQR